MPEPITNVNSSAIQAYRQMAESCRKMAAVSRRPGPLILRAQAYEANALAIERGEKQHEIA